MEKLYLVYRSLYTKTKKGMPIILEPGAVIKCKPVEAMCINTLQPMTLRETNDNRQNRENNYNEIL